MIYLDHNSTTHIHKEVKQLATSLISKMLNPSSIHTNGREARSIIENARRQICQTVLINNHKEYNIIFTSSGTESNNLIMSNYYDADVFISSIEHLSILNQIQRLPNVKIIKVDNNGIINLEDLESALRASHATKKLVSVMLANNETGVIQPIKEVAKIAKKFGAQIHSDCVQALGKIELDITDLEIDFATISAHKFGGLIGSAALIARAKFTIKPMMLGGGQEKNMRSGTENVLSIAGFGLAAELAKKELVQRMRRMRMLQIKLEEGLTMCLPQVKIVGSSSARLPNTSLIIAKGSEAQTQIINFDLRGFMLSSGSACSSGKIGKPYVLTAMGISDDDAKSAIRVSLSHYNSENEIDAFIKTFKEIYSTIGV